MTKLERKAAAAVLAATAAVTVTGVRLLKRHTRYVTQKAAAFFDRDQGMTDGGETADADQTAE